jgi:hypothetical protein
MIVGIMQNVAGERRLILKAGIEIITARCDGSSEEVWVTPEFLAEGAYT